MIALRKSLGLVPGVGGRHDFAVGIRVAPAVDFIDVLGGCHARICLRRRSGSIALHFIEGGFGRFPGFIGLIGHGLHRRLNARSLSLNARLHVVREILRFILNALEFGELGLPINVGLHLRDEALRFADPLAGLARNEREPLRPEHDERNNADDHHFAETEIKHDVSSLQKAADNS